MKLLIGVAVCVLVLGVSSAFAADYRCEATVFIYDPCLRARANHDKNMRMFRELGWTEDQIMDYMKSVGGADVDKAISEIISDLKPQLEGKPFEFRKGVYDLVRYQCLKGYTGESKP